MENLADIFVLVVKLVVFVKLVKLIVKLVVFV